MNSLMADQFHDRNPNNNMAQLNVLYRALATGASASCEDFGMKKYFGDFYLKARFSIENTFDKFLQGSLVGFSPTKKFEQFIVTLPYSDTMDLGAEVPEGMHSTYLDYLDDLIPAQQRANTVLAKTIIPLEIFVGKMISDEVFRGQIDHQINEFKELEPTYQKTVDSIGKHFAKNDFRASAKFSGVVKRTGDWKLVFARTKELEDLYHEFPQAEITKHLNRLYENLDVLAKQANNSAFNGTEKQTTKLLADGMYHVAREIELAALTTYRSKGMITAVNATIKSIDDAVDKQKSKK